MQLKSTILGALAYLVIVFPLAFSWHLVLFKDLYESLGYFGRDEPIIALGFLAIATQGLWLSLMYPHVFVGVPPRRRALVFSLCVGAYHWTTHVVAAAAKHPMSPLMSWFGIETLYLIIQFGLYGIALGMIHRGTPGSLTRNAA